MNVKPRTNTIHAFPPQLLRNLRKREEVGNDEHFLRVEEVPLCSRGFVIFNVVFALMMVLLMYLVIVVCAKEGING